MAKSLGQEVMDFPKVLWHRVLFKTRKINIREFKDVKGELPRRGLGIRRGGPGTAAFHYQYFKTHTGDRLKGEGGGID